MLYRRCLLILETPLPFLRYFSDLLNNLLLLGGQVQRAYRLHVSAASRGWKNRQSRAPLQISPLSARIWGLRSAARCRRSPETSCQPSWHFFPLLIVKLPLVSFYYSSLFY